MEPFVVHTGVVAPLDRVNVDTDQIIPAQFLKRIERTGFGQFLFFTWRLNADGSPNPDFILNKPGYEDTSILVAGRNFGAGSSREHAPWALLEFGFRAVVSTSFADIFRGNAIKNGLLPVQVEPDVHRALLAAPWTEVTIDLRAQTISGAGAEGSFPIDGFSKHCLLQGIDSLNFLCSHAEAIAAFEERHP